MDLEGENGVGHAEIEAEVRVPSIARPLRHRLAFTSVQHRVELLDEAIEEAKPSPGKKNVFFYYRFQHGNPVVHVSSAGQRGSSDEYEQKTLPRGSLNFGGSILSQRKDADYYPELTELGRHYAAIQTFREWTFGRCSLLRQPQPADLPEDRLLPDCRNLAVVLNQIEHGDGRRFNELLRRFFPRFERMSTVFSGGTAQFYLHEPGFDVPIPPTRLSDGAIRFIALLATLFSPSPPTLVCIEEPELGLHPDAVSLMAEVMVEVSERIQLVVTTHSDALVSALTNQPGAVIACERPGAGTVLQRLDPKKLASWMHDYRLGELWRMGELGANP